MKEFKMKDYYAILGVSYFSTADEIRKAFRVLSTKYHPDLHNGERKFEEVFKEINEAKEILTDPEKRKIYDDKYFLRKRFRFHHRIKRKTVLFKRRTKIIDTAYIIYILFFVFLIIFIFTISRQ
jgi:DnaJ-class molecular chaperone